MDNRNKDKSELLDEIENDTTPIDEAENPKEEVVVTQVVETTDTAGDTDEDILLDDEEIDEETGEIKKKPPVKTEEKNALPEDEKRYREQRRETTIINEKNKQLADAFKEANELADPTEDDLKKAAQGEGLEWDELNNFEKSQYRKSFISDQKLSILNRVGSQVSSIEKWAQTVDGYLDENTSKQTNKALIGKEGAFREFAMRESHRGASMDLLVSAFLHDTPEGTKHKGSLMLTRTGGERVEKVNPLMDADYVATLRRTQPKEYQRLLKAGKIKLQV